MSAGDRRAALYLQFDDFDAVKASASAIVPPGTVIPDAAEQLMDTLLAG